MINKLIIDNKQVELTGSSTPYYHTFSQSKEHDVKYGLDDSTEICAYAFAGCENMTYISLPDKITMIKRGAFKDCKSLPSITIGKNVEYIGKGAFDGCTGLEEIIFEANSPENIDVYASIPMQTTCFVPDGTKFVKVPDYDSIDISGETKYYEKTAWNQYVEIDPTEIEPENFGEDINTIYRNQWSAIGEGKQLREIKDKVEIAAVDVNFNGKPYVNVYDDSETSITYSISPLNATNKTLYWFSTKPDVVSIVETNIPQQVDLVIQPISANIMQAVVTAYAESGERASITVNIEKQQ